MKYLVVAFGLLAIAGCASTITQHDLELMRATASPTLNSVPGRSNELWYKGTKDGYDYYYFYKHGTFDTQNTYRVPTAMMWNQFDYTDNHTKWRKLYSDPESGKMVFTQIESKNDATATVTGPPFVPETVRINSTTYKLVPTTAPASDSINVESETMVFGGKTYKLVPTTAPVMKDQP